jgi:acetyltransferase-like isoleucine patch superfamily enzyme
MPYRRVFRPGGGEWAEMLKERGDFRSIGEHCYIDPWALIEGGKLISIGNNVRIATSALFCHDGSVNMINRAFGLKLDSVGPIDIRDNVYIGYGVIVLPGVKIGPNAIVSAGSVVRSDVGEGDIVAGIPARRVGRLDISTAILKAKNAKFPWREIIEKREGEYDASLEGELTRIRAEFFYGGGPKR